MNSNALNLMTGPPYFWLLILAGLYIGFCFFFTLLKNMTTFENGCTNEKTFSVGYWGYIIASTALCFSTWSLFGQPALIYHGGSAYSYLILASITLPFASILFLKRQKILCIEFGFKSPLELYSSYFQSSVLWVFILAVGIVFALSCFGLLLLSAGSFIHHISGGYVSLVYGMVGFCFLVLTHTLFAQYRALVSIAPLQFFLFLVGVFCLSMFVLFMSGGPEGFVEGIKNITSNDLPPFKDSFIDTQSSYGDDLPPTSSNVFFIFTLLIGLMGIQASPLMNMLALSTKDVRAFAPQQVWWSGLFCGGVLLVVSIFIGFGAHVAQPDLVLALKASHLSPRSALVYLDFVPQLIKQVQEFSPFLFGIISLSVVATLHMTAALIIKLTANMIKLDLSKGSTFFSPFSRMFAEFNPNIVAVLFSCLFALFTLYAAINFQSIFPLIASLGIAFSFQLFPALVGICYTPWFTGRGIVAGLIAGLFVVLLTDKTNDLLLNDMISDFFDFQMPFGSHPFGIYSAIWGGLVNMFFVILISSFTQSRNGIEHRFEFHRLLELNLMSPTPHAILFPLAWGVSFVWFFFAIGPGASLQSASLGFDLFENEFLSLWAWQFFWWAFGVFMLWVLAYPLQLSRFSGKSSFLSQLFHH